MVYSQYYSQFAGETFVIQAEGEAIEDPQTTHAILRGIDDLLRHGIRAVLVFGKAARFEAELRKECGAWVHPETSRLVIPGTALPRIHDERRRIAGAIRRICETGGIPCSVISESAVRVERRIGHGSTGVPTGFDVQAIRAVVEQSKLAVVGFGGEDDRGRFLHVPSVSLAADLAVALSAQKLLFLTDSDGLRVPHPKKGSRRLSFADLDELLCLLQRQDERGRFVLSGAVLPKVHASIRAVAGGVSQVHLVSFSRLLDEILTRTGVGTMIERRQSHHVDYAGPKDLDEIEELHAESQRYRSPHGTPYVKPLDRAELKRLLPQTLLLRHRGVILGKLHTAAVHTAEGTVQIGGFVVAENHQDSQQGQLLLFEALARLREQGCSRAVAITASQRAQSLFQRVGGTAAPATAGNSALVEEAVRRYAPEERGGVQVYEFPLAQPS